MPLNILGVREKIEFINKYLDFFEYNDLLECATYNKQSLKNIRKFMMNIVHTDKKGISENQNETDAISDIAKEINTSIDYLLETL